jgi:hypothetical protein
LVGDAAGSEVSKRFFFEKKKQKTFIPFGAEFRHELPQHKKKGQKFFGSFFQKRTAFFA